MVDAVSEVCLHLGLTYVWKLKKAHAVNSRARCVLLFFRGGLILKMFIFLAIDTACRMKMSPILSRRGRLSAGGRVQHLRQGSRRYVWLA